ncbi:MAG: hypothetical protein WA672_10030 [Candidatus Angelobacter sp.]
MIGRILIRAIVPIIAGSLLIFVPVALGQLSITGTVHNGSTRTPAAGDEVILLRLSQDDGMVEESHTRSDGNGSFTLSSNLAQNDHVIRILHRHVNYDRLLTSGDTVNIEVFDPGPDVAGISGYSTIVKLESGAVGYNVTELYAIQNNSSPPRTQVNPRNLELELPGQSNLDSVTVMGPGTSAPLKVKAVAIGPERYAINFPLRPGTTEYAVRYHIPGADKVLFHPRVRYPTRQWSIVFPSTMNFAEHKPNAFHNNAFHNIVDQNGVRVEAVKEAQPGALPAFEISGIGVLPPMRMAVSAANPSPPSKSLSASSVVANTKAAATYNKTGRATAAIEVMASSALFLAGAIMLGRYRRARRQAELQQVKDSLFELENTRIQGTISVEYYASRKAIINEQLGRVTRTTGRSRRFMVS